MSGVARPKLVRRGTAVVAVAVMLAGCGDDSGSADGGGDTTTAPASASSSTKDFEDRTGQDRVEMNVVDNTFLPRYVQVSAGTTLVFTNNGRNPHDIKPVTEGVFDEVTGDEFGPGTTAEITLSEPGEIPYYCSIHGTPKNGQNGIIKVVP